MSRYVEYDSLIADSYESDMWDRGTQRFNLRIVEVDDIEKAPSLDLVRCGECRWSVEDDYIMKCWNIKGLNKTDGVVNADDFCSYGQRKESE